MTSSKPLRCRTRWTSGAGATETGLTLIGFYHSHPDHPAVPSSVDLEHAWPNLHYLILSVREGRAETARTWRLREDRSAFDEAVIRTGSVEAATATRFPR